MKIAGIEAVKTTEGEAALWVPKASLSDPHHCEVFYNPAMAFSRTVGSIAFEALASGLPKRPKALDGLCATGARGVRYCIESGVDAQITFCDANPKAMAFAERNAKANKITSAKFSCRDFFIETAENRHFDFVELDPFGTPAVFLDAAVRACGKKAVLSATATDLANLCGARPKACVREYDARPVRGYFCHEAALRVLVGRIARTAALHEKAFSPALSYYEGHHVKTVGVLESGAAGADRAIANVGILGFCKKCFGFYKGKPACESCGLKNETAGPLWLGKLGEEKTILKMGRIAQEREDGRAAGFMALLAGENGFGPGFLDPHEICKAHKKPVGRKMGETIARLRKAGFPSVRTHFSPTGIKTTACAGEVLDSSS